MKEKKEEKKKTAIMMMMVANPKVPASINYMATFQKAKSVSVNFSFKLA